MIEETTMANIRWVHAFRIIDILTLRNQTVQVLIVWSLNTKVASANVVDSLVIDHETAIGVLKSGVGGQDRVVRLDNGGSNLRSWVDAELKLALLAVID